MDIKRIAIITGFITVTILLGVLIYGVFFKSDAPPVIAPPPTDTPVTDPSAFPTSDSGDVQVGQEPDDGFLPTSDTTRPGTDQEGLGQFGIAPPPVTQVVEDNITGTNLRGGTVSFYNDIDGQFYRLNAAGDVEALSDDVFFNVEDVTWSNAKSEAILEYPDGSNIYYNFDSKKQVTLPRHWDEFSFSDRGDSIAAKSLGISPENKWLISSSPDGKNIRLIEPLGNNADKVTIDWSPNEQIVGFSRTGEALGADREEVLFVGLNGENYKSMKVEGRGFQSEWSNTGNKLLYSVYSARSDFKPELWIVDATPSTIGQNRDALRVNTWAEKCTFSDDRFVYCGVPERMQTGAGFAPALSDTTPDRLVRIDTQTGAQTEIDTGGRRHTINSIFVDEDTNTLFFTDGNQSGLFQVDL